MHAVDPKIISLISAIGVALAASNAGAVELDLSSAFNTCAAAGSGGTVCSATGTDEVSGAGTFVTFDSTAGGSGDTFFFYNTTTKPLESGNEVGGGTKQNDTAQLGDFGVSQYGGVDVFTFILDINQFLASDRKPPGTKGNSEISLDHVALFLGDGSLSGFNASANGGIGTLGGEAPVWYLTVADYVHLDFGLGGKGDGRPDLYLYLPVSLFGNAPATTYLQLYSRFGEVYFNNDGPEQWAYQKCGTYEIGKGQDKQEVTVDCYQPDEPCDDCNSVPEPGSLALLGLGLLGMGLGRGRHSRSIGSYTKDSTGPA